MINRIDFGKLIFIVIVFLIICFLFIPIIISIIISFNASGLTFPPTGFTLKWYKRILENSSFINAMKISLMLGLLSAFIANIIATLASFAMTRYNFKGKDFLNIFFLSPLMIPGSVVGLALYTFLVEFSNGEGFYALLLGHILILTPYSMRIIMASLQRFDISLEEAAMSVGANRLITTFKITLPTIKTGLIGSFIMCFIVSWNNFALALYLAGSKAATLPLELYSYIRFESDSTAAALVTVLVVFSWLVIMILDNTVGISLVAGIENK